MSPEIRAMLEAKHKERAAKKELLPFDAHYSFQKKGKKGKKSAKKRRKAAPKKVGIRTMKELSMVLAMRKHGKPKVKKFSVKY
jgi:hypothetical protein